MSEQNPTINYNAQFNLYLNKSALFKKGYKDRIYKGGLRKEINKKCKSKLKGCEEKLISLYRHFEIKRNKYIINNYSIALFNKEIKNPLTPENLGKYLFKFYYSKHTKRRFIRRRT